MRKHAYSTDSDYRVKVAAGLGILAYVSGTWLANFLKGAVQVIPSLAGVARPAIGFVNFLWSPLTQLGLRPEAWVPATGFLFAVFFALFNQRLWRHPWIQSSPFVSAPDLSGTWEVKVRQREAEMATDGGNGEGYDSMEVGVNTKVIGKAEIEQTWRKILVFIDFDDSTSISLGASFITDTEPLKFNYHYRNEPKPPAPDIAQVHYGTTDLHYNSEQTRLEGEYFTNRFRKTSGEIILEKTEN